MNEKIQTLIDSEKQTLLSVDEILKEFNDNGILHEYMDEYCKLSPTNFGEYWSEYFTPYAAYRLDQYKGIDDKGIRFGNDCEDPIIIPLDYFDNPEAFMIKYKEFVKDEVVRLSEREENIAKDKRYKNYLELKEEFESKD